MLDSLSQYGQLVTFPISNLKVRAVSEWGAEGEWAVETVTQTPTSPAPQEGESSIMYSGTLLLYVCAYRRYK